MSSLLEVSRESFGQGRAGVATLGSSRFNRPTLLPRQSRLLDLVHAGILDARPPYLEWNEGHQPDHPRSARPAGRHQALS